MFATKQSSLFTTKQKASAASTNNAFITKSMKSGAKTTALGNGAVKFTTTGNDFVDQFGKITQYKAPRAFADVAKDMQLLWSQNQLVTLMLLFYIRMVTRVVQFFDGSRTESSQRGQGLKHEGIFRMIWVAINAPSSFAKNLQLFISVGSWKDIFTMLSYDLQYNGWKDRKLDWNFIGQVILAGLENPNTSELVKKYLPQIKSNSQCTTLESQADNMIAKWICSLLFGGKTQEDNYKNYRSYRKLKSGGTAHQWQQLISQGKFLDINFDSIHGRALAKLVSGKFIANKGLTAQYQAWIDSKPVAKYTGFVYELFTPLGIQVRAVANLAKHQVDTINKQFLGLIEVAKNGMAEDARPGFIVVIDSSASMTALVQGTKTSAYAVAKSLALYFSYLLPAPFNKHFLEFSNDTIMKEWKGNTPVDQFRNEDSSIIAGTNFQSVADHFATMLRKGVPESDFPTGILCVSDGCFNSAGTNKTNRKEFLNRLTRAGFSADYVSNFKIVLWDIPNSFYGKKPQTAFESFADAPNMFHMSGLDGSAIAFLLGVEGQEKIPTTSNELFEAAMSQPVLQMIEV